VKAAFIFPGQGSQFVGMGRDIADQSAAARGVYDSAFLVLGWNIAQLCFEGPEKELNQTQNAQLALLVTSLAHLAAWQEKAGGGEWLGDIRSCDPVPSFVAGHSLGEYTALVAAGVLNFEDGLRLVAERARLMQEVTVNGGMSAILGLGVEEVEQICRQAQGGGMIGVANDNCPGQVVISGQLWALEEAEKLVAKAGAKRVIRLKVSGPFHSPAMRPVAQELSHFMKGLVFKAAAVPVVANFSARPLSRAEEFPPSLAAQLYSRVQWTRSVEFMISQGVTRFYEIGPGSVLRGLVKRISKEVEIVNV